MSDERSQVLTTRMEKLALLRERGIEPFAYSYDVTDQAARTLSTFAEAEAEGSLDDNGQGARGRWAGRMVGFRSHGKSAFADLEDVTGRIQLYIRKNVVGEEAYELLDLLDQ